MTSNKLVRGHKMTIFIESFIRNCKKNQNNLRIETPFKDLYLNGSVSHSCMHQNTL